MKTIKLPDYILLHELLIYKDGMLYWKVKPDTPIINIDKDGYSRIGIGGKRYKTHRIIYKMHNPNWDETTKVDHKNNIRNDNRISNLQLATHSQNTQKCIMRKNNTTGYKGVIFNKRENKYVSQIRLNGKTITIGRFDNPKDAADAYDNRAAELFGKFALTNKILLDESSD